MVLEAAFVLTASFPTALHMSFSKGVHFVARVQRFLSSINVVVHSSPELLKFVSKTSA
jgi:hypothetical protein